jgi:hypothetical protein
MCRTTQGLRDLQPFTKKIIVGSGKAIYSTHKGSFVGSYTYKNKTQRLILKDTLVVPDLWMNLFAINKALSNGARISNNGENICLHPKMSTVPIVFNNKLDCGSGYLLGTIFTATQDEAATVAVPDKVDLNLIHQQLGHPSDQITRATAIALGIKATGIFENCDSCARSKAKSQKIPKVAFRSATRKGERIYMDISSVQSESFGKSKFWLLLVDEYTNRSWSFFLHAKSDLKNKVIPWILRMQKEFNVKIQTIRCDNAGENIALKHTLDNDKDLFVKFEFTAPDTPQQNGVVERKFQTLYNKVRSALNGAELSDVLRHGLWAQCAETMTKLDNFLVSKEGDKCPYEMFDGTVPNFKHHLRVFGEVGIITSVRDKMKPKLADRGYPCLFVGYPDDHSKEVLKFFNLNTKKIVLSRNVTWTNKFYETYRKQQPKIYEEIAIDYGPVSDIPIAEPKDPTPEAQANLNVPENDPPPFQRIPRMLSELHTTYNPVLQPPPVVTQDEETTMQEEVTTQGEVTTDSEQAETATSMSTTMPSFLEEYGPFALAFAGAEESLATGVEPTNYKQAMKLPSDEKLQWQKAMHKEFKNMEEKGVWKIVKRTDVPYNRRLIGNRWVYKLKDDGTYRARTVAKGYNQIPGQDFTHNFAPVVNDVSMRIALTYKLLMNLDSRQFDVETAFLYGDLEEEIYMEFPEGYTEYLGSNGKENNPETHCLLLIKAIYGLVQAARQWWKKFKESLKRIGYTPSPADPCFFIRKVSKQEKLSIITIYVDDGGVFGETKLIESVLSDLSKEYKIKVFGPIKDYVGCSIIERDGEMWIHQPKIISSIEKTFSSELSGREAIIPAASKTSVVRPQDGDAIITAEHQSTYRSGVGMVLYTLKTRPDVANATRELTKVLDKAAPAHYKYMLRCIKYILETRDLALHFKPQLQKGLFTLLGRADSEFSGDKETRISVYGYILYFCGCPVSWKSKMGRSVTLSSTEAEYVSISELAKEVLFVKYLLDSMGLELKYPIIIETDNIGAIYFSNNHTTSQRMKHVDTRYHFVRNFIEDGILKVQFVRSAENEADIFTKNVTTDLFVKHRDKILTSLP